MEEADDYLILLKKINTNSFLYKAASRYCTLEAPVGMTKNQIDFEMSSDRKIGSVKSKPKWILIVTTEWSEQE